jgi:hypothetical protein
MVTVFVSYSHADRKVADDVARGREERGLSVWIDGKAAHGGAAPDARLAGQGRASGRSGRLRRREEYAAQLDRGSVG